ncbi:GNAT family N-acetyltransferase [Paraneptunicella aestuarii]|uniref:GNAT family N-acetyltransferase n=1 Tax=Paraneptunicella aestuarii TaxID=2831148 RepID=UPI001E30A6AE|nr:GNAT family N-acetyltransferase [Paraneptunicella aestuarii]UAA39581.1 GNAT family N-acetyltransferase [Paraneptunicella aestuarii]
MVTAQPEHIKQLFHWFDSKASMFTWGGPGMRYPSNQTLFLRDIGWLRLASVALIPQDDVFLPSEEQRLMGFAQIYPRLGRYHFGRVAISPNVRGQGLGSRFLARLIESIELGAYVPEQKWDAVEKNCNPQGFIDTTTQKIYLPFVAAGFSLFVLTHNQAAIHCYQKHGFREREYPEALPGNMQDCLYMVRGMATEIS